MDFLFAPNAWIALLTLTFLEIVLGVDNIIFISIVSNKLPAEKQEKARKTGLFLALFLRIAMLISVVWVIHHLTKPLFTIMGKGFSVREIILFSGGLFLLAKSVSEIGHKMEGIQHEVTTRATTVWNVIFQIAMLDIVFSFDSILTAVGLSDDVLIMIIAVVVALSVMMAYAGKISQFISQNPTLEILALSFLILIGFMLVLEGFHIEIPKAYIYFAVFFSLTVEVVNMKIRKKRLNKDNSSKSVQ
jgi:predicted tellurium resistance membrane protein TerC